MPRSFPRRRVTATGTTRDDDGYPLGLPPDYRDAYDRAYRPWYLRRANNARVWRLHETPRLHLVTRPTE